LKDVSFSHNFVTDGQIETDRRQCHANNRSYCVEQYDWLIEVKTDTKQLKQLLKVS